MQLPGFGVITAMTVLAAIGDTPAPTAGAVFIALTQRDTWRATRDSHLDWNKAGPRTVARE